MSGSALTVEPAWDSLPVPSSPLTLTRTLILALSKKQKTTKKPKTKRMAKLKRLTISSSGEGAEQWNCKYKSEIIGLLSRKSYFGRVQYDKIMVNLMSGTYRSVSWVNIQITPHPLPSGTSVSDIWGKKNV